MSNKYVVYFDRLDYSAIEKLREIIGAGELAWTNELLQRLPDDKRAEFGRVACGRNVSNVRLEFERNVSNGFNIPVIIGDIV